MYLCIWTLIALTPSWGSHSQDFTLNHTLWVLTRSSHCSTRSLQPTPVSGISLDWTQMCVHTSLIRPASPS